MEVIEKAGEFSKKVHFIISGDISLMNKKCMY